jgi:hypothetical protein
MNSTAHLSESALIVRAIVATLILVTLGVAAETIDSVLAVGAAFGL